MFKSDFGYYPSSQATNPDDELGKTSNDRMLPIPILINMK